MFDNKFEKPQNMDNRSIFERDYAGEPEFMHNGNNYLTMLGTGNALATRCYNTCFTLHGKESVLLVDAGGGNGPCPA